MSDQAAPGRVAAQAASGGILIKLVAFSFSLAIVPISSYFVSLKYVYHGNPTFAAITAVFAANIVLVVYIVASLMDDKRSIGASIPQELKKTR